MRHWASRDEVAIAHAAGAVVVASTAESARHKAATATLLVARDKAVGVVRAKALVLLAIVVSVVVRIGRLADDAVLLIVLLAVLPNEAILTGLSPWAAHSQLVLAQLLLLVVGALVALTTGGRLSVVLRPLLQFAGEGKARLALTRLLVLRLLLRLRLSGRAGSAETSGHLGECLTRGDRAGGCLLRGALRAVSLGVPLTRLLLATLARSLRWLLLGLLSSRGGGGSRAAGTRCGKSRRERC